MKSVIGVAVVMWLWVWDGSSLSVNKGHSLIEIWAVFKSGDVRSNVLSKRLFLLLCQMSILSAAVISCFWVWNGSGLSINKGESFIKVGAVLQSCNISSDFGSIMSIKLLLSHLIISVAVESNLWEWDSSSLTISQSESLIKIWAMFKRVNIRSPVWISLLLLNKLVILVAVESNLWEWDSSSFSISQSEPFIKVRAVLKGINIWSPVWIINLKHLVRSIAVISNLWVWDGTSLTISKGEALIEIGAMFESTNWSSPIWISFLLNKSS